MCTFYPKPNFRIIETCPHHVVRQGSIKVNGQHAGMVTSCVSCNQVVAISSVEEPKETTAEDQNLWVYDKLVKNPDGTVEPRKRNFITDELKERLT